MSNILHRHDDIHKFLNGGYIRPHFCDLHTSDVCNQACTGCAYAGKHSGKIMSYPKHMEAVDKLIDFGVKAFDFAGGGEPTMMPYLDRLMEHMACRGAKFGLITNGMDMSAAVRKQLIRNGTYVRFSLEVPTAELYEKYKNCDGGDFHHVLDTIRILKAERDKAQSRLEISLKFSVGAGMYQGDVSMSGAHKYLHMLTLSHALGVDRVNIKRLVHEPCQLPDEDLETEAYSYRLAEELYLANLKGGEAPFKTSVWLKPYPKEKVPYCKLSPVHTVMDQDGNLYVCCYYYYRGNDFLIGNIFETPLSELWLGPEHRRKLSMINRDSCAKVDCKFFKHHQSYYAFDRRGAGFFL